MSYFLAAGCSFTDAKYNLEKVPSVITWPDVLSEKLQITNLNLGLAGASTDYFHRVISDHFILGGLKPSMVSVGGTESQRFSFKGIQIKERTYLKKVLKNHHRIQGQEDYPRQLFHIAATIISSIDVSCNASITIDNFLYHIIQMKNICDQNGVPFVYFQLLPVYDEIYNEDWERDLFSTEDDEDFFRYFLNVPDPKKEVERLTKEMNRVSSTIGKTLLESPYFPIIDGWDKRDRPIGWPFLSELGGFTYKTYGGKTEWNKALTIDMKDAHPNSEGHKIIADIYYKHLMKYGI